MTPALVAFISPSWKLQLLVKQIQLDGTFFPVCLNSESHFVNVKRTKTSHKLPLLHRCVFKSRPGSAAPANQRAPEATNSRFAFRPLTKVPEDATEQKMGVKRSQMWKRSERLNNMFVVSSAGQLLLRRSTGTTTDETFSGGPVLVAGDDYKVWRTDNYRGTRGTCEEHV